MDDTKSPNNDLALINKMFCLGHAQLADGTWVPKYTDRWNPAKDLNQALNMLRSIGASLEFVTGSGHRRIAQIGATRMLWSHQHRINPNDPFVTLRITYQDGTTADVPLPVAPHDKRCPEPALAALITDAVEAHAAAQTAPSLFITQGD